MYWLIDFDDTLVVGPITWALDNVIPALIAEFDLPDDPPRLANAILTAQRQHNQNVDEAAILDDLFTALNWPDAPKKVFVQRIYSGYQPTLFEDALPFLERLQAAGQTVFVVSNNDSAPQLAEMMGISAYFRGIFTPKVCGGVQAKPQRAMWDYLIAQHPIAPPDKITLVGDDPWSDGAFADVCGIQCWILDRMNRFASLHDQHQYQWARSLAEVVI